MSDANETALRLVWGMPDACCGPRDDGSTREACIEYSETGDRCECPCRRASEPIAAALAAAIEAARRGTAQRCAEIAQGVPWMPDRYSGLRCEAGNEADPAAGNWKDSEYALGRSGAARAIEKEFGLP